MQIHALSLAQKAALFAAAVTLVMPHAAHAAVDSVPPLLGQMDFTKVYDGMKNLKKLFMAIAGLACLGFIIAAVISHNRGDSDEVKKRLLGVLLCGGSTVMVDGIFKFFGFSEVASI